MDIFNNGVGISYCWNCFPFISSDNSIANDILTKLNNGELRYISNLDHSDPYWYVGPDGTPRTATDGITPSSALIPTNQ